MLMELNSWLNLSVRENVGPCFFVLLSNACSIILCVCVLKCG